MTAKQNIFVTIIVGVGIFTAAWWYVNVQTEEAVAQVKEEISIQDELLFSYAEALYRNTFLDKQDELVSDCRLKNRNRFDNLLINLETLSAAQFAEIDTLFDACARFSSEKKAVTLNAFTREIDHFEALIAIFESYDFVTGNYDERAAKWRALAAIEEKRLNILTEQVEIQSDIIALLKEGATASTVAVRDKILRASEIEQTGSVLVRETNSARAALRKE